MEYLRDGEQVCWHGVTKPFPLLERDAKVLILAKWIGSVTVSAIILALYMSNNPDWSLKVVGVILLIAALLVISPSAKREETSRMSSGSTPSVGLGPVAAMIFRSALMQRLRISLLG